MHLPNLKEIFYSHFSSQDNPVADKSREHFITLLDAAKGKYSLSYKEYEDLYDSFMFYSLDEQYLGFLQGFSWAIKLITGSFSDPVGEESSRTD